jgi:hypothetical protein
LKREPHNEGPTRYGKKLWLLQHVEVNWSDADSESEQANPRGASRGSKQQACSTNELERTAHPYNQSRRGYPRWNQVHFGIRSYEVRHAADKEPQEHESNTNNLDSVWPL